MSQQNQSYLETPYLNSAYLNNLAANQQGQQVNFKIDDSVYLGKQSKFIIKSIIVEAQQFRINVVKADDDNYQGQQFNTVIDTFNTLGIQYNIDVDITPSFGQQVNLNIQDFITSSAHEMIQTNLAHSNKAAYLVNNYLQTNYLNANFCAQSAQQIDMKVIQSTGLGQQINTIIVGSGDDSYQAQQVKTIVEELTSLGMQISQVNSNGIAQQFNISLYNTNNLRILCNFASRGNAQSTGNNAWGNSSGTGNNWKASSTASGDHEPFRLNTDIVEEKWRSASGATSGITLDCDTEKPQGVVLDTLAILNTNISTSANLSLIGSDTSNFSNIGVSKVLSKLSNEENIYYIADELPIKGYRYWRIAIDDNSNTDNFISIGTIVFGVSNIFFGECFVDNVELELKDYTDSVSTSAFTNIKNSRAQKKILNLDFRSLDYNFSNYKLMRSIFQTQRTILKCLWIPTPRPSNQSVTSRFAVFAKLTSVPRETHNNKGDNADYVSFSIQLDEAE